MRRERARLAVILPPLNALRVFEATARLKSLSRAGEELHVTHAAVSGQIKKLEAWLGRRLFERTSRGAVLTAAGEQYCQAIQPALTAISAASRSLSVSDDRKGVAVACIPSVATRWLIPALPRFCALHPDIAIEVSYSHAHELYDPARHDVLITYQHIPSKDIVHTMLFSSINKPVASPAYLARSRCDRQLNHATLLHDEFFSAWDTWFDAAGYHPYGLVHGPLYQDFNLLSTAVIAGHGVALCPVEVFRRELARGELVVLSDVSTLDDHGYYLVHGKASNHATQAFGRWFVEVCSE